MNTLPSSIEAYLQEAGFSVTELIVLKKLFEEDALTLRQIAAKTGKSTGVLDQAMKKLLRRNIITKEHINETIKYRLISVQAIAKWVEEDTRAKQEMLKRRHQNFEAFITSLKADKDRPAMQYFEGEEGMRKAYGKLLDHGTELLHYYPVVCAIEDDPLRDFRVELFRERRRRGIFARYIVHNTPLGRRFASRDAFEYRKTILVPEETYPIAFEKVIAGDIVACFNHGEKRVCFLCYPQLAQTERALFERLWQEQENAVAIPAAQTAAPKAPEIPLATRTLSSLRAFFLSKKSLALLALFALVSAGIVFGIYRHTYNLNLQRLRERAMSITATGAMQFDAKDLDQLRTIEDIKKPEYAKVIKKLNEIRDSNPGIAYSYIMRPAPNKVGYWEFVADADSLDPFAKIDANADGVIDDNDELQYPGLLYEEFDPYFKEGMTIPFSTPEIHYDQYGVYFTTTAPIRDASGKTNACYSVDIKVEQISLLTWQSLNYVLFFVGLFLLFVIIRLAAFNKSLLQEVWQVFQMRKVLVILALCAEVAFFITLGQYYYTLNFIREEIGQKLVAIASTAANQFDANDLNQIRIPRDMEKEAYQRVFKKLNDVRDSNMEVDVKWAYIMRPAEGEYMWEFVGDADANFNIPCWTDADNNGIQTPDEMCCAPGVRNYQEYSEIADQERALSRPLVDRTEVGNDQWGNVLSASAPITDRSGKGVAILGIDADYSEALRIHRERFIFPLWFAGTLVVLLSLALALRKWK
ncbi:MAG: MarR family winged helix-turn-helix transcriptional regulator [Candidatus Peribacteraceae bacterium]|jgi:DNA-binding MarR family transcriptional regulator